MVFEHCTCYRDRGGLEPWQRSARIRREARTALGEVNWKGLNGEVESSRTILPETGGEGTFGVGEGERKPRDGSQGNKG